MSWPPSNVLIVTALLASISISAETCQSAQLKPETARAFDEYIRNVETAMDRGRTGGATFLWIDNLSEPARSKSYSDLAQGKIVIQASGGQNATLGAAIPGGLIHDWIGTVFVPRVSIAQALVLLQDYDRDQVYYSPEVVRSKTLERAGNRFRVFLRLKKRNILTVVFDTEYNVQYAALDGTHTSSRSYSTRIAEVQSPDTPQERELPVGDDQGFLWRLYSYWRFYQTDAGTFIQCRAISLSRDVPTGLGWIVRPFIEKLPVESLRFTLNATRNALMRP